MHGHMHSLLEEHSPLVTLLIQVSANCQWGGNFSGAPKHLNALPSYCEEGLWGDAFMYVTQFFRAGAGSREPGCINVTKPLFFFLPNPLTVLGIAVKKKPQAWEKQQHCADQKTNVFFIFSERLLGKPHHRCSHTLPRADEMATGGLQQFCVKETTSVLTQSLSPFVSPPAAVLLSAGGAFWGGGAGPQAAAALGRAGEAQPAAEGARSQGEALTEERPQGRAQGRAGGAGAAVEAEVCRAQSGAPPQCHNTGRPTARALRKHSNTPTNATLTFPTPSATRLDWNLDLESERLLGGL